MKKPIISVVCLVSVALTGCNTIMAENERARAMSDQQLFDKLSNFSTARLCEQVIDVNQFRDERTNKIIEDVLRERGEYRGCLEQRRRIALEAERSDQDVTVTQSPQTCIRMGGGMVSCF